MKDININIYIKILYYIIILHIIFYIIIKMF